MQPLPLEGVRVLDLTRLLPGPLAGLRLVEMGAEVIKIEDPGPGDNARAMFRSAADEAAGRPGAFYRLLNRGKRVERMDLKDAADRERFLGWIDTADILIEGFRPGVMARIELDYESLKKRNARLVYCAISGYGQQGAWARKAGHDINYIGMAGVLDQLTDSSDAPIVPNFQIGALELKFWQALCDVIGKPAWKSRHWMLGQPVGGNEARAITTELSAIFLTKTQDEWSGLFDPADCCVTPVLTLQEALAHPLFGEVRTSLMP